MASEVIFDSEVYFVSEVSPDGEVANLTSLLQKAKTSLRQQLHFELCGCDMSLRDEKN